MRPTPSTTALTVSLLLLATSCGGDSTTNPPDDDGVATITVSPADDTILVGDSRSMQATARDGSGSNVAASFTWSSTSGSVASVDQQGTVQGLTPGSTMIRALAEGVTGNATIVVQPRPVATVDVAPIVDTVRVGEEITLTASILDDRGDPADATVDWSSDDADVAAIVALAASDGPARATTSEVTVVGVAAGTTTLRATADGVTGSATVVVEPQPVASVDVTPVEPALREGQSLQLVATPRSAAGDTVEPCTIDWSVDDAAVASVSDAGEVTGIAAGQTVVTAAADCGAAGQADGAVDLRVDPPRVVATGVGRWFGCALVEDAALGQRDVGQVYCWGANNHGQVGDGTFADHWIPTRVDFAGVFGGSETDDDPSRRAGEILVVGDEHGCALTPEGEAWCWGDNVYGQLGDGTFVDRSRPVAVGGGHRFRGIVSGEEFTCGLDFDAAAWCWGEGLEGQLGNGATSNRTSPVAVAGGHEWSMLRAGEDQVCGITTSGTTYCWGDNNEGAVGDGTTVDIRAVPTEVVGPTAGDPALDFRWIAAGKEYGCGLEEGTDLAWCWGNNDAGQLGIGSAGGIRTRPVAVSGPDNVFQRLFDSSDDNASTSCGMKASAASVGGPAWCWGANTWGQLGDGTTVQRTVPTPVATDEHFLHMTTGEYHACGITTEFRLMCWGDDRRGQLGNGAPLTAIRTPVFVDIPGG